MSHAVNYNQKMGIIEAAIRGELTLEEIKETITKCARVAKATGCVLILNDYREATTTLSVFELYTVSKTLQDAFNSCGLDLAKVKRAVVVGRENKSHQFYETATSNRGLNAKVFFEIDEARNWLLEQ